MFYLIKGCFPVFFNKQEVLEFTIINVMLKVNF